MPYSAATLSHTLMAAKYYISTDGNSVEGPYAPAAVATLLRQGKIASETLVCPDGTEDWTPLSASAELSTHKDIISQLRATSTTVMERPRSVFASSSVEHVQLDSISAKISKEEAPISVAEFRKQDADNNLYFFEVMAWIFGGGFLACSGAFAVAYFFPVAAVAVFGIVALSNLVLYVFLVIAAIDESIVWVLAIFLLPFGDLLFSVFTGKAWTVNAIRYCSGLMIIAALAGAMLSTNTDDGVYKELWKAFNKAKAGKYAPAKSAGDHDE